MANVEFERQHSRLRRPSRSLSAGSLSHPSDDSLSEKISRVADSRLSQGFFIFVILANAITLGVELDHRPPESEGKFGVWFFLDSFFTTVFLVECLLRMAADRSRWHKDPWNVFDACLVLLGIVDSWVLLAVAAGSGEQADMRVFTLARILRLLRISRVLRMLRLLRFFKELLLLTRALSGAMTATFWSATLLLLVLLMFGLFLTRAVGQNCCDEGDAFNHPEFKEYFGTLPRSLFTLFATATMEGWPEICRLGYDQGTNGLMMIVSIIFFIFCTHLVVMNLIAGFFIENVLGISAAEESRFREGVRKQELRFLQMLLTPPDDDDGVLGWELMQDWVVTEERAPTSVWGRIMVWLGAPTSARTFVQVGSNNDSMKSVKSLSMRSSTPATSSPSKLTQTTRLELAAQQAGVTEREVYEVFELLDLDGSGKVDAQEFVRCLSSLPVPPSAFDLQELRSAVRKAGARVRSLVGELSHLQGSALKLAEQRRCANAANAQPTPPQKSRGPSDAAAGRRLAQLRESLLRDISAKESELAAKIPQALEEMRAQGPHGARTLDLVKALEERVFNSGHSLN